jgi:archaellum component FlaF (FlaF/FlaG flagellin family)
MQKLKCKRDITYKNISSRVIGLVDNDLETECKHIFQISKLWDNCISEKGHNLKNIGSMVMGLEGYDVYFDGKYIFEVSRQYLK